jgi:hypothetical protein
MQAGSQRSTPLPSVIAHALPAAELANRPAAPAAVERLFARLAVVETEVQTFDLAAAGLGLAAPESALLVLAPWLC